MYQNEVQLSNSISPPAVLLFAGYMIPYDNLGKTYEFNVLQVPWRTADMHELLARLIECECWNEEKILTQPPELIFDTDLELLARGKGVRVWLVTDIKFVGLVNAFLQDGLSDEDELRFTDCVDRIGAGPATLEIRLQPGDVNNLDLADIEHLIEVKLKIKNSGSAIC